MSAETVGFIVSAGTLTKVLAAVAHRSSSGQTRPSIQVSIGKSGVEFLSFGTFEARADLTCESTGSGTFRVDPYHLKAMLDGIGKSESLAFIFAEMLQVKHSTGTRETHYVAEPEPIGYSSPPQKCPHYTLSDSSWQRVLRRIAPAMSSDFHRQMLVGVWFDGTAGKVVATNTHMLSVAQIEGFDVGSQSFLVSREVVERLSSKGVKIFAKDRAVWVVQEAEGYTATYHETIAGTYPTWEKVVPAVVVRSLTMDRKALAVACRRVSRYARDNANRTRMSFSETLFPSIHTCVLKARSEEIGSAEEYVPLKEGKNLEGFECAFNYAYVLSALGGMDTEDVTIEMTESSRPIVLKDGSDDLTVIMPMALA